MDNLSKKLGAIEKQLKDIKEEQREILNRLEKLEFEQPEEDFPERFDQEVEDE